MVYRSFCRIGPEKVPDAKTLVRLGQAIGAATIRELHDRMVALAGERKLVQGRKMRGDTTGVETNVPYPTDSGWLNDGARVLTRTMKKIEQKAGGLKKKIRNRMRRVTKRVIAIGYAVRHQGPEGERKREQAYRQRLRLTRQILHDSQRVLREVDELPARRLERVRRVVRQRKARIFQGVTQFPDKLLSVFEAHTELIRKGKASKPNEFGKLVQIQEAEHPIITHYEVFADRPSDRHLLRSAVEAQQRKLGRVPRLVAGDAGFYSHAQEQEVEQLGVK